MRLITFICGHYFYNLKIILSMNIFNRLRISFGGSTSLRHYPTLRSSANAPRPDDLYEPRFESGRKYPDVALLNVLLQAYDFQPVEKFQAYVHWAAKHFGIRIVESYALAHTSELVKEYKAGSTIPVSQYVLKTYNRVVRVGPVPGIQLPLFIILLQAHAPVGMKITVKKHCLRDERCRYIPDPQLEDFKETLRNLDDPVVRKLLGWEA